MGNTTHLEACLAVELDGIVAGAGDHLVQYVRDLTAQEDRNNCRRRFVGSQTVGIRRTGDTCLQQTVVFVDGHHDIDQEGHELQIGLRRFTR